MGEGVRFRGKKEIAGVVCHPAQAGDTSRCGEIMVESAYAQLCSGNTKEALFMFQEVRDVALARRDDFLSQVKVRGRGWIVRCGSPQIFLLCVGLHNRFI